MVNFVTAYFISSVRPVASGLLKIKIIAKRVRELTTKFALERSEMKKKLRGGTDLTGSRNIMLHDYL